MLSLQKVIEAAAGKPVVLDHVRVPQLTLAPDRFRSTHNQVAALDRLMYGMRYCHTVVKHQESMLQRLGLQFAALGMSEFKESGVEEGIIYSCFDWYAINACRFFQLRGFIADQLRSDLSQAHVDNAKAYRSLVCGPVNTFRDKIAAHFAETDPKLRGDEKKRDNVADLFTSTMLTIGFKAGRLRAGAALGGVVCGDEMIQPKHDIAWSITEFHEQVVFPRVTGKEHHHEPQEQ